MDIGWKSLCAFAVLVLVYMLCGLLVQDAGLADVAFAGSMNGAAGQMPAFYD